MRLVSSLTALTDKNDLKWRLIRSALLLVSYFGHGMGLGVVGPTMLDLQIRTNSTLGQVTLIILGRAAGLSIGSFLAGPLASLLDTQLAISLALLVAAVTSAGIPWPTNVAATIGTFFVTGLGFGIEETSLYLYMLFLWGAECEPFMQALHFSFGVGASVAPLIARQFILSKSGDWTPEDVRVHWCYEIIAACCIVTSALFWSLWKFGPPSREHPSRSAKSEKTVSGPEEEKSASRKMALSVSLLCIFCFFYCGIEVNFGAYLTPYAVDGPLGMNKQDGALIAAVYWAVFTFSRLLTVFYIKRIGSRNNLILCTCIILGAQIVLVPWPGSSTCLWVGSVLVGLGASSVLASIFGFMETSAGMQVTPLVTSFTIAFGCLGQSAFPVVTSALFERDARIFLWLTVGAALCMALFLGILLLVVVVKSRPGGATEASLKSPPAIMRLNSLVSVTSKKKSKR